MKDEPTVRPKGGMGVKPAALVATIFLALVGSAYLVRVALRIDLIVGGIEAPMWISLVACVFTGGLAILLWRENRR
jgi:hypothetical protein